MQENKTLTTIQSEKNLFSVIKTNRDGSSTPLGNAISAYAGTISAVGYRDTFKNYETDTSLRTQYTRDDYEFFRPQESIPSEAKNIIFQCRSAYRRVGIIRNVMDLMSDFGAQGATLVHPNKKIQDFYNGWWRKVNGPHVCERFLNLLYREGVSIIRRTTGYLPKTGEKYFISTAADKKLSSETQYKNDTKTQKRNIPLRYNFLNPLTLVPIASEISQFVGENAYAIKISTKLRQAVNNPKNEAQKKLINYLPDSIREAIKRGDTQIPLDPDKVKLFFYKKDDWQTWADPMTYSIMDDLILLEKMKLADLAALDGAISQIRLWKLGDIESGIFPTNDAINKLNEILLSNTGGGAFDIIWGPELTVEEYKTNVHQFLGKAKYEPVLSSIYEGLGVPRTLTGAGGGAGFTNNYISLKTLIQRLEYGRSLLRSFWSNEIELVRQAMGFKIGAKILFDNMVLSDEAAEKALLVQLVDRDIIAVETLLDRFGELPEFENLKLKREAKERKKGNMKEKASPWHTPEKMFQLIKIALQKGFIAPEQTGMTEDFPEEFMDVETPFEITIKSNEKARLAGKIDSDKNSGDPLGGRPINSKDKEKRDSRTPKPIGSSSASFLTAVIWARDAQNRVSEIMTPVVLKKHGKKSLRALSSEQVKQFENAKFSVLCNIEPYSEISVNNIREVLQQGKNIPKQYLSLYNSLRKDIIYKKQTDLSLEEDRMLQINTYAALNCNFFDQ